MNSGMNPEEAIQVVSSARGAAVPETVLSEVRAKLAVLIGYVEGA